MAILLAKKVSQLISALTPKWGDLLLVSQDQSNVETSIKETLSQIRGYAGTDSVASATVVDLGQLDSVIFTMTGIQPISSFGSSPGITRTIFVQDGFSLINSSQIVCPQNTNLVLSANDVFDVISDAAGVFYVSAYYPYNGFTALYADFIGDSGAGGVKGLVPAPPAGSAALGYVLGADGTWGNPGTTSYPSKTVTANYSVLQSDYTVLCNAASGAIAITLPDIVFSEGKVFNIKKLDSSFNLITISGDADIDGSPTYIVAMQYQSVTLQCNGTFWSIL